MGESKGLKDRRMRGVGSERNVDGGRGLGVKEAE